MRKLIVGIVFVLLFLVACTTPSLQGKVQNQEVVKIFTAMSGGDVEYSEAKFSGADAKSIADLVGAECPQGVGEEFTRVTLEGKGMSLVLYTDLSGDETSCVLFKPDLQTPIEYLASDEAPAEGVALTVNGEQMMLSQVQSVLDSLPEETPRDENTLGQVLNQMVNDELLRQEASMMSLSDEDMDAARSSWLSQQNLTEEALTELLVAQDVSVDEFYESLYAQARLTKLLQERLLLSDIAIAEEDARQFYLDNPNQFVQAEQAIMRHILVSAQGRSPEELGQRTQMILSRLNTTDFCQLVSDYSDDQQNKESCGVYVITRGIIDPNLEYASFNTPVGQTSVVTLDTGVHLVQTVRVVPAQVVPFAQVSQNLQNTLANTVFQQRLNLYLTMLRSDAEIKIYLAQ